MEKSKTAFNGLLEIVGKISNRNECRDVLLAEICAVLVKSIPYYNWVGFYLVDPSRERELILGPYIGAPTDHIRIPFGRGICGQAAKTGKTFIVDDVSKEDNYLACSINVKSEIVLPIFCDGVFKGELDIDSHSPSAFTEDDESFLSQICNLVGPLI